MNDQKLGEKHKEQTMSSIVDEKEMNINKDDNIGDDSGDVDDNDKKLKPGIESSSDVIQKEEPDPILFWLAWNERKKACFNENGDHVSGCNCFEGLGSVM